MIGGAGKLGGWFADFLGSQGFMVEVSDPAGTRPGTLDVGDWRENELTQDFNRGGDTARCDRFGAARARDATTPGVIFDVGSLKSRCAPG